MKNKYDNLLHINSINYSNDDNNNIYTPTITINNIYHDVAAAN